jgi:DNA polymerase III delta prime subunit
MSKIIEIESALSRINGDVFQDFCNHFLFLKLNPNSIDPLGSVIGKEKSRIGTPDCYFTKGDDLIFAEYTTKEKLVGKQSFLKKLKNDIDHCFNEAKTGISPRDISKVILCFTNKLKPIEREELNKLCSKYNNTCTLELIGIRDLSFAVLNFPSLGEYLGIKIGTGQILTPSEFITNYEKSKLSTPLSNQFFGRQEEIKEGLEKLETFNVLLIHGTPGTGKSRYALELSSQFVKKHEDFKLLCIGNKGLSIWDDLQTHVKKDTNYVIIVDDANRVTQNYRLLLGLLKDIGNQELKIIVTVRDYALPIVKEISNEFNYTSLEINKFENKDIIEIIKTTYSNIQDPLIIERITELSKGNARLALMCAKLDNILLLNDASQIYEEYFTPIFNEVEILNNKNTLISLAIISFFGKIDKENRNFCEKIFSKFNFDEDAFWETCYDLNESELVDLEFNIVRMTDQVFSTYIFYKAVIDKEYLSFKFFLDNFLDYENRISDTIIPVINTFDYKKIEDKLKNQIIRKWQEVELENIRDKSLKFLDLFWYYLYPQTLVYFRKHIDNLEESKIKTYRYTYELNEFSYGAEKIIEILSRFRLLQNEVFEDALELLFYYALKIPDKLPAVMYVIKERFSFKRFSYSNNNVIQHTIIDFLISKAQNGNEMEIFESILLEVIPHYFQIEYHNTSNESNGRAIALHTFHLWSSDSIKSFRKKCFDYLISKAKHKKPIVIRTIYNWPVYDYKHSIDIFNFEKGLLFSLIEDTFDPEQFEDCFVLQELIEKLEIMGLKYPIKLKLKFSNKLYVLTEVLKSDKNYFKKGLTWQEEEKLHKKELFKYCDGFQLPEYLELFDNISLILEKTKKNHVQWQYKNSVEMIFSNIATEDNSLFLEVLDKYFDRYDFKINFYSVFISYFKTNSKHYFDLFKIIKNAKTDTKLNFHNTLIIDSVSQDHNEILYEDLKDTINGIDQQFFFYNLNYISKYAIKRSELAIYQEILDIILFKIRNENIQISVGKEFIEKCLEIKGFPFDKICSSYYYANKFTQSFDFKKDLLRKLVKIDTKVLIELLKLNFPDRISYHDLEHENYDFIWELDNYRETIKSLIDFFLENKPYLFWERTINAFFPKSLEKYGNKPIQFLHNLIQTSSYESNYMEVVFNIICYSYPSKRDEFLKNILLINSDVELFKKLELVKRGGVFSGSRIPYIEKDIKSWEKVLVVLAEMSNRLDFFEHKEYVEKQISYCRSDKKRVMKREFFSDF